VSSNLTPEARFWSKVVKTDSCWIWTAGKDRFGYGQFKIAGVQHKAHRVAYEWAYGSLAEGLCALHNCPGGDNPSCVNPAHLYPGTVAENNADRSLKGRTARGDGNGARLHPERVARGERQHSAKLTPAQVREIRRRAETEPKAALAREFGISPPAVGKLVSRRSWAHVE
jgi:hypothetical protein